MTRKTNMIAAAAVAAMAAGAGASAPAAADPIPQAASYADLFEPVPDALTRLQTSDTQHAASFQEVQYYGNQDNRGDYRNGDNGGYDSGRNHHHHHSNYRTRRWYQSHGYSYYGGRWQIRPRHHHHHHHNNY